MASRLKPLLNDEVLLFPVAKPTAALLNWWLGREGITLLREQDFRALLAWEQPSSGNPGERMNRHRVWVDCSAVSAGDQTEGPELVVQVFC